MESVHAMHGCCDDAAVAHAIVARHCCGEDGDAHKIVRGHCCGFSRHFVTKQERREALEQYREQLKKELTGVEEHLNEMG
jgi:predicted N-acyltransferase